MGSLISPDTPDPPPLPAEPPPLPTPADPDVIRSRQRERARAGLARGTQSTILTSAQGLTTQANTAKKSVLGV